MNSYVNYGKKSTCAPEYSITAVVPVFAKNIIPQQRFTGNSDNEFRQNLTRGLVADTRIQKDEETDERKKRRGLEAKPSLFAAYKLLEWSLHTSKASLYGLKRKLNPLLPSSFSPQQNNNSDIIRHVFKR